MTGWTKLSSDRGRPSFLDSLEVLLAEPEERSRSKQQDHSNSTTTNAKPTLTSLLPSLMSVSQAIEANPGDTKSQIPVSLVLCYGLPLLSVSFAQNRLRKVKRGGGSKWCQQL